MEIEEYLPSEEPTYDELLARAEGALDAGLPLTAEEAKILLQERPDLASCLIIGDAPYAT